MVRGIETFKQFFKGFEDNYVIIGGTACEIHEDLYAQVPRATKDIDIILIVEALSAEFVAKFWEFVKMGNYEQRNKGVNENVEPKHEYFRFMKPANPAFPYQVELFSRSLGLMNFPEEARITPIPVDEDLSSLSAILMDEDYYRFTIEHSLQEDGVHIANIESLICLKSKAFLDLSQRKAKGESMDSKHIAKHKKDVFRLAAMLAPASRYELPDTLKTDVSDFCDAIMQDLPNADFIKSAGLGNVTSQQIVEQLKKINVVVMVKIQYASDLHLEFMENTLYLEAHPLQPVADILVLAGDTGYLGDEGFVKHPFWDWASENFKEVIVIPGNHEFYLGYDLGQLHDGWCMEIRHNIKCYYNAVIHLFDDTDLIVSTLWGHIEAQDAFATERSVNDFYRIKDNGVVISCEQFNKEHDKCRAFIEKAVGASKAKHIVVATHHVPSFELVSPDFMGSSINGAFTAELGNFIAYSHIDYWIYGHSHRNIDKVIGQTKCISNQLGYVSHGEAKAFDFMKCINL